MRAWQFYKGGASDKGATGSSDEARAHRLFLGSLAHLPILIALMLIHKREHDDV
jgi:heme O synthase-like polyprenyltransferase